MSLILCRPESVKHPFLMEDLGIHIYSSQELCYVIYHHPLLVMDHFIDERLLTFIQDELDMEFLSAKLIKWIKSGEGSDELLIVILQDCYYYNSAEIGKYKQQISVLRKKHPADYAKTKADYLFRLKQYGKAIAGYEKLVEYPKDNFVNDLFKGKVWNNLGSAYTRMFQFEKAYRCLEKAYDLTKEYAILQKLYYITLLNPIRSLDDRYQSLIDEETAQKWKDQMEEAYTASSQSEVLNGLEELFKKDPIKRMAGASEMVRRWKQEYRNMV